MSYVIGIPSDRETCLFIFGEGPWSEIAESSHAVFLDVIAADVQHDKIDKAPERLVVLLTDHALAVIYPQLPR